jgi:hypothetical protein
MVMLLVIAIAAAFALASVGGGLYEFLVVDPFWPKRPDLIQPSRGGISLRQFSSFSAVKWALLRHLKNQPINQPIMCGG